MNDEWVFWAAWTLGIATGSFVTALWMGVLYG